MEFDLSADGVEKHKHRLNAQELALLQLLADENLQATRNNSNALSAKKVAPGVRLAENPNLSALTQADSTLGRMVKNIATADAKLVRALLFDKTIHNNWALGWHQDRTIAVQEKHEIAGYTTWSKKSGVHHVEPPFEVIEAMLTVRIHLDPCDEGNAPLLVAPKSHAMGRIAFDKIDLAVEACGQYACLAEAGDIWLYKTAILHASNAARKASHRRVLQLDFSPLELPEPLKWYFESKD